MFNIFLINRNCDSPNNYKILWNGVDLYNQIIKNYQDEYNPRQFYKNTIRVQAKNGGLITSFESKFYYFSIDSRKNKIKYCKLLDFNILEGNSFL